MRPGREHDTTTLRADVEALPLLTERTAQVQAVLADLGYEGERAALTTPIKQTADRPLTADQRTVNLLHAATRALAECGNSLLTTTFKALRRVSLCPGGSARSPPPPWCCSTNSRATPHDQQAIQIVTGNGSLRGLRLEGGPATVLCFPTDRGGEGDE